MSHRWPNLQDLVDCDGELVPDMLHRLDAPASEVVEDEICTYEVNR